MDVRHSLIVKVWLCTSCLTPLLPPPPPLIALISLVNHLSGFPPVWWSGSAPDASLRQPCAVKGPNCKIWHRRVALPHFQSGRLPRNMSSVKTRRGHEPLGDSDFNAGFVAHSSRRASWCTPHSAPLKATLCCSPTSKFPVSESISRFTVLQPGEWQRRHWHSLSALLLLQLHPPSPPPPQLAHMNESLRHQEGVGVEMMTRAAQLGKCVGSLRNVPSLTALLATSF